MTSNDSLRVGDRVVALAEIEARLAAATPGRWRSTQHPDGGTTRYIGNGEVFVAAVYALPDVVLLTLAPTYIAALLQEVRRLRVVESAARELRKWDGPHGFHAVKSMEAGIALDALLAAAPPETGGTT